MRILLKITGEALKSGENALDYKSIEYIASQINPIYENRIEIGIVIGGGNLFRGKNLSKHGFSDFKSHYIGMLSTLMNAIALEEVLTRNGIPTVIFSSMEVNRITKYFNYFDVNDAFAQKKVCIFPGGTGNPFFTTDSAAALKAAETDSDLLIKATKVDGVYSEDPVTNKNALYFPFITYQDFLMRKLKIMDLTAIDICQQKDLPIIVLDFFKPDNLYELLIDKRKVGSLIHKEEKWPI